MPRQTQMTKETPAEEAPAGVTAASANPAVAAPAREIPVRETPARATPKEVKSARAESNGDAGDASANGEALEAMMRANEAMLQGMATMQREIMEFGNARLRQDLETQEALSHCDDLQEAYRLQADFAQKAMQQYAEETAKLIELSTRIGRDCWGPFEDATRAAMKNMTPR